MAQGQFLQQSQRQIQTLHQMLNPQMLNMLHFFNLPYGDLVAEIQKEASDNPLLEITKSDQLINYVNSFRSRETGHQSRSGEKNFNILENTAAGLGLTLEQFLISQLRLAQLKEKDYKIGLELIGYIDQRGYIEEYFEKRHMITDKLGVSRQKVDEVLRVIQGFEPDGVGARNLKECLLIQIAAHNFENEELRAILEKAVREHLELISGENQARLAAALGIEIEGAGQLIEFIRQNLTPNPGSQMGNAEELKPVIPSYSVEWQDSELKINCLEERLGPALGLNPEYMKMLESGQADESTLNFIKEKLKRAELFLKNIERRKNTLQKIVEEICQRQQGFFKEGASWLEPLPQKELSKILDLHPSIISRVVSQKYIQTPKGIFNLKFLCPRNISGFTPQRIKAKIQSIIRDNVTNKPFSDEKISQQLKLAGINIQRRTVTKYRLEMKLPSSHKK